MPKWSRFFRISFSRAVCVMVGVKQHLVLYGDGAGVRRFQKVQTPQQRGFAAAGGADDGKGLSLLQREADVIEDLGVVKMLFHDAVRSKIAIVKALPYLK